MIHKILLAGFLSSLPRSLDVLGYEMAQMKDAIMKVDACLIWVVYHMFWWLDYTNICLLFSVFLFVFFPTGWL